MRKYLTLFQMYWQNSWVYPISFVFWRLRQFLLTFAALTMWATIYQHQVHSFGYTRDAMISYIFLTGFLQSLILATQTSDLAQQIYTGDISNILLKPLNIFAYLMTREAADKFLNFTFVIIETIIFYFLFRPTIIMPPPATFLLFSLSVFLGALLLFLIMLLMGTIGFWSPDTWGPRYLFYMFIDFTAGKLYPLTIFPQWFQRILFFTPFPYLTYIQTQIFLGTFSASESTQALLVLSGWIIGIFLLFHHFWRTGMNEYGAVGR